MLGIQFVFCDKCPLQLIELDVLKFEYLFLLFPLRLPPENNKYSTFKIRHIQIEELPRTLKSNLADLQYS